MKKQAVAKGFIQCDKRQLIARIDKNSDGSYEGWIWDEAAQAKILVFGGRTGSPHSAGEVRDVADAKNLMEKEFQLHIKDPGLKCPDKIDWEV